MANSCNGCGLCCHLFLINLSQSEYESGNYRTMFAEYEKPESFSLAKDCGANLLAKKKDGSCVYLTRGRCSIHEMRPEVCREFFCSSKAKRFENMIQIIKKVDEDKVSSIWEDLSR